MCLIIVKPENKTFNDKILDIAWTMNPDGGGFMYWDAKANQLVVRKGFFSRYQFIDEIKKHTDKRIVVHFRYSTHGAKDATNCHPFMINKDLGFVHNGQMHNVKIVNKHLSDTWHFNQKCKQIIKTFPTFWKSDRFKTRTEKEIGTNNKLVFMDNKGEIKIYNEKVGFWLDGLWYSNARFVFGSWNGLSDQGRRAYVKDRLKYIVKPYKVSFNMINEGANWFLCDHCHCIHKKNPEFPNLTRIMINKWDTVYLCDDCNNEAGFMLNAKYNFSREYLDKWDVNRIYTQEMKRQEDEYKAQIKAMKEKEEQEKLEKSAGIKTLSDAEYIEIEALFNQHQNAEKEEKDESCCPPVYSTP